MAYGVKYYLDFDDINGKAKRLEILKKDYTGVTLPVIGSGDPVSVKWKQGDNVYSPIMGAVASISFYVNNDSYFVDDFFSDPEKTYKVIAYDGSDVIFVGWLVADQYKEQQISEPYLVSFSAFDGLGTLNGYQCPVFSAGRVPVPKAPIIYIAEILKQIGLDLPIKVSQELKLYNFAQGKNVLDQVWSEGFYFDKEYTAIANAFLANGKIIDSKEALTQICNFFHCRIFQANGYWWIINKSGYADHRVKDNMIEGNPLVPIPPAPGIPWTPQLAYNYYLNATNKEVVEVFNYDVNGAYVSTSKPNVLKKIKSDLIPLNQSLVRLYDKPLQTVKTSNKVVISNVINDSGGFEWQNFAANGLEVGWTLIDNCEIQQGVTISGENTLKLEYEGRAQSRGVSATSAGAVDAEIKFAFDAYFPIENQSVFVTVEVGGHYWNETTKSWQLTQVSNEETRINNFNKYRKISYTLGVLPDQVNQITVYFYTPILNTEIYIDNCFFTNTSLELDFTKKTMSLVRELDEDYSADFEVKQFIFSNKIEFENNGNFNDTIVRPYDYYVNDFDKNTMEMLVAQYILNDRREKLTRYSGQFRGTGDTIFPFNKVWYNLNFSLSDDVSCYIDAMSYSLKKSEYSLEMHMTNQDDDLTATVRNDFDE